MDIEKQPIRFKAILEIIGKPKEYVESKIKEYIDNIKNSESAVIVSQNISDVKEYENEGAWSVFAEIEVVVEGLQNVIGFCIDYMPSSIEIVKPENFEFRERIMTKFINEIMGKLHNVDLIAKKLNSENLLLKKNMNVMIKNNVLILLKFGVSKLEKICLATGIEKEQMKEFLKQLMDEKRVKEVNGDYLLA